MLFDPAATMKQRLSSNKFVQPDPVVTWHSPSGDSGLGCWLALPPLPVAERYGPPLVVIHGLRRDAYQQAVAFGAAATALGRPVVAPLFATDRWPRYQQVVQRGRADLGLLTLMAALRADGVLADVSRFDLFGFSAGAQFAHRFAMLHPEWVRQLSAASAGWYTFFDKTPFPYGLGGEGWGRHASEQLAAFLAIPTQVFVGADDITRDSNLRQGATIDAQQGQNRVERARRWTAARNRAALDHGFEITTGLHILEGCRHSFASCAAANLVSHVLECWGPIAASKEASTS